MSIHHILDYSKSTFSQNGQTLFKHLTNIIEHQTESKNQIKGMNHIQIVSNFVKNNRFQYKEPKQDHQINDIRPPISRHQEYIEKSNTLKDHTKGWKSISTFVQNPLQQYLYLSTAGISIGQANYQCLLKTMKVLTNVLQMKQIRFWGKILGFHDYYVIQGISKLKSAEHLPKNAQVDGTGINYYTYAVSRDVYLDGWTLLPPITPQQLKQSREIKHIFTGDLNHMVNKNLKFDGVEKHLLKAQIVRITHACEISPKGLYKISEQNPGSLDFEDEFKVPELNELVSPQNWVHINAYILNQGRTSYYNDSALSQQQKEAQNAENAEKDPPVDRLKSIVENKALDKFGYASNWLIQTLGQAQVVNQVGKQQGQPTSYGVVLLKNLNWPGAFTIGYSGGWTNIYIGYGHKLSQNPFYPLAPKDTSIEGEQKQQVSQPNPKDLPVQEPPKNEQNN